MPAKINLVGERFNKLLVLEESKQRKSNRVTWLCQCDCGNTTLVTTKNLREGITQSCGCLKKKNLIGQKFGKLTVIDYTNESRNGSAVWKCQCECGNITYATTEGLRVGDNTTCGKQECRNLNQKHYEEKMIGKHFGFLEVIEKAKEPGLHGSQWICKCDCGNTCIVTTNHLITGNTQSCGCLQGNSIGEIKIKELLSNNNISFKQEYIFKELPNRRYDFAIFDDNGNLQKIIEFDGEQHYQEAPFFKKTLQKQQDIDKEKTNFLNQKNIPLLRIPYWKRDTLTFKDLEIDINELSQF